jgi:hypothetical protein
LVERLFCKQLVAGSSPADGFKQNQPNPSNTGNVPADVLRSKKRPHHMRKLITTARDFFTCLVMAWAITCDTINGRYDNHDAPQ